MVLAASRCPWPYPDDSLNLEPTAAVTFSQFCALAMLAISCVLCTLTGLTILVVMFYEWRADRRAKREVDRLCHKSEAP